MTHEPGAVQIELVIGGPGQGARPQPGGSGAPAPPRPHRQGLLLARAWRLCTGGRERHSAATIYIAQMIAAGAFIVIEVVTEPKGIYSLGLTKLGFVFYPIGHLNTNLDQALKDDSTSMTGFRIVDTDVTYEKKEMKFKKSKTLIILSVHNNQKWWAKKINYEKVMRSIGFQFVDLDKDEYELIKTFEKGFDSNSKSLATWIKFLDNNGAYGALLDTPKRKKYPINRFQSYLAFEE